MICLLLIIGELLTINNICIYTCRPWFSYRMMALTVSLEEQHHSNLGIGDADL